MGLFDECQEYFNTKDLYEVLGISRTASDAECIYKFSICISYYTVISFN